ncbi:methylamine utilization protein MauG [Marinomonas piezotolerans]|uniref:Methylamine utilization protein MauG n=1 Tax=Marinomonas piezotolerans TaxID=2213058 RepID=A0A370UDK0_9GAMM|nr:cytochrome c peroxidase [Marinomonas piezotolerans]RDL45858.1 methylamine utilization protein MauG [Marinomonas piezotolerans]
MNSTLIISSLLLFVCVGCTQISNVDRIKNQNTSSDLPVPITHPKAQLGSQLFFDVNLSKSRNLSCASCHDVGHAFVDKREIGSAVSRGSDEVSLGGRNAPTASYAALTPVFHKMQSGEYRGGQFLDGRAIDLQHQAAGPFVNPVEMQMPTEAAVIDRIMENEQYVSSFKKVYGNDVFLDKSYAFDAVTDAIAHFEQTQLFMPFNSKYDRVLKGEASFTSEEELGRTLFFSQQFTNCAECHQLNQSPFFERETFTNYEYRNIGVPKNSSLKHVERDLGLLENPNVLDKHQAGKFRVPTLRNVAVTGPYMHNGVFNDLRTVVKFYDHYNNPTRLVNPETGKAWSAPEVPETVDMKTLTKGPALSDRRVDALVAFLKTLTDQQYEYLQEDQ